MKRSFLLFTATAGIAYLTLSSNSFGPASSGNGNRTGSPGSNGTCAAGGCHGAISANTTGSFSMIEDVAAPGTPVTSYMPGHTYAVTISGNHPNNNNFGFQAIALNGANAQVGSVTATDAKTHKPATFTSLIEHNQPIGKTGGSFVVSFNWTAPATPGSGNVTLYGIINAVNNVPGNDPGDQPSNTFTATLTESTNSVADLSSNIKITAFPNPATSNVNIKFDDAENGTYTVKVMDVTGRTIQTESVRISGTGTITLQTANWASGLHFAQVMKDGAQRMIPIVKN